MELQNIAATSGNNGICRFIFQLTSVSVLSDVVIFRRPFLLLTPNGTFWIVSLLHSVSDFMFSLVLVLEQCNTTYEFRNISGGLRCVCCECLFTISPLLRDLACTKLSKIEVRFIGMGFDSVV